MGADMRASGSGRRRSVASLTLAEQIVVWGLRRYQAARAGLEPLAPMFQRIFGPQDTPRALESFSHLIDRLNRRPRGNAAGFMDQHLSAIEAMLLELMTGLQRADRGRARIVAVLMAGNEGADDLIAVAGGFAALLEDAGFGLREDRPAAAATGRLSISGSSGPAPEPQRAPAAVMTEDLAAGEMLLLQAIRLWVGCVKMRLCGFERIEQHFQAHAIADAAPSLHAILHHTAVAAERPVDVRCPPCRLLSPDEALMLHAVACGQRARTAEAYDALSAWLPPTAARLTLDAVAGISRALRRAEIELPLRRWDFELLNRLAAEPHAAPDPDAAGCTIH